MSDASESRPRRVPRFISCLVKGPLGCLAFLVGAGGVLVLLLPPAGGRMADRLAEEWFAERHQGRLELADAWVGSFYGPQRIESLILRDPEGEEVLRAELRAPALGEFFDAGDGDGARAGPLEVRIASLRLIEARDGSTNLARALATRPRGPVTRKGGITTDEPFELVLDVRIERLRYADAEGHEGTLDGLVLRGSFFFGPYETRLALEGGPDPGAGSVGGAASGEPLPGEPAPLETAPVHALVRLTRRESDPDAPWKQSLLLENLPSVLGGLLVAAAEPLVPLAGPRLDSLSWQDDEGSVSLRLQDEGAQLTVTGRVEPEGRQLSGEGSTVQLALPCSGARARTLLTHLLPLVLAPECPPDAPPHELRLTDARWPLDGDWTHLAGELDLQPAPARTGLVPALAEVLGGDPVSLALGARQLVRVRDGMLEYALFRLPIEQGFLQLDGTLELASGLLRARVTGERAGVALDLGTFEGTRTELAPARELPTPPSPPEGLVPVEPETLAPPAPQPDR